jgi:F-type H+-transporting ATPase subunit b
MFLSLDGTFWFQLINFGIFFAILNVVFSRPVGKAIMQRRAYIEAVQNDYGRNTDQARKLRAQAEQLRAAARREADERIAAARAEGETTAAGIAEEDTAIAAALTADARATVAVELAVARTQEAQITATLAKALLQRALGEAAG